MHTEDTLNKKEKQEVIPLQSRDQIIDMEQLADGSWVPRVAKPTEIASEQKRSVEKPTALPEQ